MLGTPAKKRLRKTWGFPKDSAKQLNLPLTGAVRKVNGTGHPPRSERLRRVPFDPPNAYLFPSRERTRVRLGRSTAPPPLST